MMKSVNCLIVDDEPVAREIVQTYCNAYPGLTVVGSCENALDARRELEAQKVDIVFLDINMPLLDGLAFMKIMKTKPQVIFTTAYKEYALDAFDLAACDYLLKPFSLERFIWAVDKAIERINKPEETPAVVQAATAPVYIFLKSEGKIFKVSFDELLFAEALGNYTKVTTSSGVLLPIMSISTLEQQLPSALFLRTHRSYIINKSKISHIDGNRVFIGKYEIPIGASYRDSFLGGLGL
ncbi:LytR/AlgR family response regulator transcription factor [Desertivirga brevis]|uniref:LytR/AlgR family response regulator transcription factor n=1 Tax=Desertivirga brevis TaxID=2810310 RepID=UPI001A9798F7|nr:LytTR family DNA-binding domain-containing protein [Pedobacter sp. SYSU D00873]